MFTLKPGDTSRTTGSATRWNSLTPSFMRQGKVQPLRVTTGLYGRPVVGTSGGAVSTDVWMTGSGKPASAERATARPATEAAAPAKNWRLELLFVMNAVLSMRCCRGHFTSAPQ